jgi:hypothetical protein
MYMRTNCRLRIVIETLPSKPNGSEANTAKKREVVIKKAFPLAFKSAMDEGTLAAAIVPSCEALA